MNNQFEKHFSPAIWQRGELYFDQGKVVELKVGENGCTALIEGSSLYEVSITLHPITMECNCPHAYEGFNCKHMAAACCAYEVGKSTILPDIPNQQQSYTETSWYPYIKHMILKNGTINATTELHHRIEDYLINVDPNTIKKGHTSYVYDLLLLLRFISMKIRFYQQNLFVQVMETLYQYRKVANNEEREQYDKDIKNLCLQYEEPLFNFLLDTYFREEMDTSILEESMKIDKKEKTPLYLKQIFRLAVFHNIPKKKIEALVLPYMEHKNACNWLYSYYMEEQQCTQAMEVLETYCFSSAYKHEDVTDEQMKLFELYTFMNLKNERDQLFHTLLKSKNANVAEIFRILKTNMSEQNWLSEGKMILINWANGKPKDKQCNVYEAVNAGDLTFKSMIEVGFTIYDLETYFDLLYGYDAGLLLELYKIVLKNDFIKECDDYFNKAEDFMVCFRCTNKSSEILKFVLIELKEEFQGKDRVLQAIEYMEDMIYENETSQ